MRSRENLWEEEVIDSRRALIEGDTWLEERVQVADQLVIFTVIRVEGVEGVAEITPGP